MHVEALQTLLDRCAQAMTPEQLEAAGIRATPPAPAPLPAGHEGVPVGGAISMNGQVIPPEAVSVGHGEDRDR
jgi:hypothetical protein